MSSSKSITLGSGANVGKLYYTNTSCGAASFIVALAAGVTFESEQVSLQTHLTQSGADFYAVNPKGNVPTLVLPNGQILNEGAAVLQYIADKGTDKNLAFENGSDERYQLQNTLNYLASDLHAAGYGPLFRYGSLKETFLAPLNNKLKYVNDSLLKNANKDAPFLFGKNFSIADSYLYIILSWSGYVGVDLSAYAAIKAFQAAVADLPVVKQAHEIMNKQAAA